MVDIPQQISYLLNQNRMLESKLREAFDTINMCVNQVNSLLGQVSTLNAAVRNIGKTSQDFPKYSHDWIASRARERNLSYMSPRSCSICSAPIGYQISGYIVTFDANCDCTSYRTPPRSSSFAEIAALLGSQDNDEIRLDMAIKMGLEDKQESDVAVIDANLSTRSMDPNKDVGWEDIGSAPQDGRVILGYAPLDGTKFITACWYNQSRWYMLDTCSLSIGFRSVQPLRWNPEISKLIQSGEIKSIDDVLEIKKNNTKEIFSTRQGRA